MYALVGRIIPIKSTPRRRRRYTTFHYCILYYVVYTFYDTTCPPPRIEIRWRKTYHNINTNVARASIECEWFVLHAISQFITIICLYTDDSRMVLRAYVGYAYIIRIDLRYLQHNRIEVYIYTYRRVIITIIAGA